MRALVIVALLCSSAQANKHVVERGETLEHVARIYGCSVDLVLRVNRLNTTLVKPGTVVVIPSCTLKARARARERIGPAARARSASSDADARARRALAVIDGTTVIASDRDDDDLRDRPWASPRGGGDAAPSASEAPNRRLRHAERLRSGDGYKIRRPHRAFGAPHVVDHLQRAITIVRALYPDVHTLAIGDLSARRGGKLDNHVSHQTGLDVDLGFYFHVVPEGYPDRFVAANGNLDLEATWALLTAFARTTHKDDGVQIIFLDYDIQARLHAWARKRGTPDDQLAQLLQYPRGKDSFSGLVRHWPHHADHLHVRFKPARGQ